MLAFDQWRANRLLVLAPLFDEANKFRHQLFEIMRRLDTRGIDCFCPDLPGCNESTDPLRKQTLAGWRDAAKKASVHVGATHVFAFRSSCWLVPGNLPGWLYAPAKPRQILRSMIRARVLAAREAGREETHEALLELGRVDGIELAGWQLGAELVRNLEAAEVELAKQQTIIDHSDIGGKPLWLRAENDDDPEQADALTTIVATGILDA